MTDKGLRGKSLTDEMELGMEVEDFTCRNILKSKNLIRCIKPTLHEAGVNGSGKKS